MNKESKDSKEIKEPQTSTPLPDSENQQPQMPETDDDVVSAEEMEAFIRSR